MCAQIEIRGERERERVRYGGRHVDRVHALSTDIIIRHNCNGILRTGNSTMAQRERTRENIIIKLLSISLLLLL